MTVAFVLSGGGSLGAVQVGMLQALADYEVSPDLLVGTSAGAVNAANIATHGFSGESAAGLEAIWTGLRRRDLFPFEPFRHMLGALGRGASLFSAGGLKRLVATHLPHTSFGEMRIPLHVIAADVLTGEEVVLSEGDAMSAILASAAIPGVLPPVVRDGRTLVDGGIVNNTAISQAAALGADTIIVLATGYSCALACPPTSALGNALHAIALLMHQRLTADIRRLTRRRRIAIIPPPCPQPVSAADFTRAAELIASARSYAIGWLKEHPNGRLRLVSTGTERTG